MKNWIARYYNIDGKELGIETFNDRTEHEASREATGLMPHDCEDWSLMEVKSVFGLNITGGK
jgi:hypothetical protein